ncbi:hypothetical protein CF15_04350 [Pyrodictium occultum]|uniref:Inositolphosphotransferase Aur1/Ipt1 domain-containing protein n=1 Tax=Pyrodictium occultum TaxID=2309 RepID=A0A0V8RVM3_PYROC|nr:phosphatase PAP2 family protein [Pyrodictium occultum]KSW12018.1 hypothetical protein CF15_04350 [Pyrodictium occultum]
MAGYGGRAGVLQAGGGGRGRVLLSRVLTGAIPFIVVYIGYESARDIALRLHGAAAFIPTASIDAERRLFGETLAAFFAAHRSLALDVAANLVYALHPLYFLVFSFYMLFRRPRLFRGLLLSFLAASSVATLVFALYPTAPPWVALPGVNRPPNSLLKLQEAILGMGTPVDPNPFAAMPSMHVCVATLFAYYLWRLTGRRLPGAAWVLVMALATFYTANHYLLDAVAGILLGLASGHLGWLLQADRHAEGAPG